MSPNDLTPRRGRPPRIDQSAIVAAVREIGSDNVTMRRVAEHLGISLPGLYHHVKNQNDLLRLAAESALVMSPPPRYTGEHWATWMRSYASYIRTVLASEPALVERFVTGGVRDDMEMECNGDAVEALAEHGLSPDDAMAVWAAVSAMAIGSVTEAHREHLHAESGQPWLARIFKLTAKRSASDYPTLRAIAQSGYDPFSEDTFQHRMTMLLTGIAVQYGLPPEPTD
ncbi:MULTISPECIES: TetR/AcrR family transcriptional regulator C-terminal domain-containing protein [unclassified Mycolicibacterium]|uniref:TetR/AcrR family transcriptional regulator C-terminal domain-containing protein n=1 Tax=unclassified Mycolicibacterium TaxID=2636767 RepID=UPI0012DCA414|nr:MULTISPECIES: TetR/AcrR family transcriptional regulator C-terminal domain-containing protein [unclassified Mycolicibacterium]MUL84724.1 TetR family transcriptional regulator [Mycolicibacterium sp. CBMA 329]MUL88499.1 TetR family transcriptional regulator [Mycolicibacterium sp. CBMA 331]MUM00162.1 TetR family transcriptional regulator [Mycolicibacterium sp. CBMA 334]MUM27826.1 TetR family transcriptional regulator [Mycolicibacterium sp. CBMA 295]MUM40146.1 TetR family transcriptional regula